VFKQCAAPATGRLAVASRTPLPGSGEERTAPRVESVARERLPVERGNVLVRGGGRALRGTAVGAREWVPVGHVDVLVGGGWRTPRDAAVVARKRLPVGFGNVRDGGGGGYLEMLQWALANGCPWDERACTMAARGGHLEVVLALIEVGADVNADLPPNFSSEVYRATPLYYAVEGDHEAIMRALIGAGADVNTTNQESETPLFCAAKDGHETMVRALIEASADVNKAMDIGATPLYIADREGHETIVQILTEAGAV
jgi:hypothetical protein